MTRTLTTTMTFTAEVAPAAHTEHYDEHALSDVVRFHVNLSDLDSLEADVSAFTITGAVETPRPIRPGDLVAHRYRDLDPREVVSVGRDFLTLDILGRETERLPLDNYVLDTPADGVL